MGLVGKPDGAIVQSLRDVTGNETWDTGVVRYLHNLIEGCHLRLEAEDLDEVQTAIQRGKIQAFKSLIRLRDDVASEK